MPECGTSLRFAASDRPSAASGRLAGRALSAGRPWRLAVGLAACALTTGCPGTLDNKEDFQSQIEPLVDPCNGLITKRCALSSCHNAESASVDLTLEGREERTVNKPGVTCEGKYVDTANPEASLMYSKCAVEVPTCGSPMPLAADPLSDDELSCLLDYLRSLGASGASGSSSATDASSTAESSSSAASGGAGGS